MNPILIGIAIAVLVVMTVIYWGVRGRVRRARLHELSTESCRHYAEQWRLVEINFIDEPQGTLREADRLAVAILSERGAELHSERVLPRHLRDARRFSGREGKWHRAMKHYQAIVDDACGRDLREAAEQGRLEIA